MASHTFRSTKGAEIEVSAIAGSLVVKINGVEKPGPLHEITIHRSTFAEVSVHGVGRAQAVTEADVSSLKAVKRALTEQRAANSKAHLEAMDPLDRRMDEMRRAWAQSERTGKDNQY